MDSEVLCLLECIQLFLLINVFIYRSPHTLYLIKDALFQLFLFLRLLVVKEADVTPLELL